MFFQHHITTHDPFQMTVLRAEQQRAVAIERFCATLQQTFAHSDGDVAAKRGTSPLPFIR